MIEPQTRVYIDAQQAEKLRQERKERLQLIGSIFLIGAGRISLGCYAIFDWDDLPRRQRHKIATAVTVNVNVTPLSRLALDVYENVTGLGLFVTGRVTP